ncbi:MAG TPA: RDD family protein, partial [Gemmataceae bacterium]|nr:RDD family protein [Gemmataceae bacterium]
MQWTDNVRIETPEQIDVSLELAGLGSRFVARVLDWMIKLGIAVVVGILGAIVLGLLGYAPGAKTVSIYVLTLLVGLFYAFFLGYDIYFEVRRNGQTPGKRRAGIRVIREEGAPLDFRSACIRNLLGTADFLPAFYLLGGLFVLLTPRNQRLGDLAAGTIVIRERAVAAPADVAVEVGRLASPELVFTADQLAACNPNGRHILRSFFQRYHQLADEPRHRLARSLAE